MSQGTTNTFHLVKNYFQSCFSYLKNTESSIWSTEPHVYDKEFLNIQSMLIDLVDKYCTFKKEHPEEVFVLLINKGIREVIIKNISETSYKNSSVFDSVVADGEIEFLFYELNDSFASTNYSEEYRIEVARFLEFCLFQIQEVTFEYQTLIVYTHNTIDLSNEQLIRSVNNLIVEQHSLTEKLNKDMDVCHNSIKTTNVQLDNLEKQRAELQQKTNEYSKSFEGTIKTANDQIVNLADRINRSEKKMHDSSITILGIFSAIVLTFSTTVNFFASVIDAFSSSSSYKVVFILLIVGLICICSLMGLFHYLWKVREDQQLNELIEHLEKDKDPSQQSKRNKPTKILQPFKISIFIIATLILTVLIFWGYGVIEKRNKCVNDSLSLTTTHTYGNVKNIDFYIDIPVTQSNNT